MTFYEIKFYKNGEITTIKIDNYIPCVDKKPCFSYGSEWISLLEKARAQVHGSYENIFDGKVVDTLRDFLGAPAKEYLTIHDKIIDIIDDAHSKNFLMTATTTNSKENGLIPNHTYTILSFEIVVDKTSTYHII